MRALPASIAALLIAMPAFAQDKATIDKLNTEVMAAFAKGDMAALGQMYTADVYLLPPDSETVVRRSKHSGQTLRQPLATSSSRPWT